MVTPKATTVNDDQTTLTKISHAISHMKISFHMWIVWIPYVKLIFIREPAISCVEYMFRTPTFHTWNYEPVRFTCELVISYVKTSPFYMWMNISKVKMSQFHVFHMWKFWTRSFHMWISCFICENVLISYVNWKLHMWKCFNSICFSHVKWHVKFSYGQ